MGVVDLLDCLLDGLAVSNLRLTNVSLNLELTLHTVNDDVQVQLTHTTNFGLTGFFVQRNGEGAVSYTHLDVYKRQSMSSRFGLKDATFGSSRLWLALQPLLEPAPSCVTV